MPVEDIHNADESNSEGDYDLLVSADQDNAKHKENGIHLEIFIEISFGNL